jgi:protein-arginine kinase activator protein McsA
MQLQTQHQDGKTMHGWQGKKLQYERLEHKKRLLCKSFLDTREFHFIMQAVKGDSVKRRGKLPREETRELSRWCSAGDCTLGAFTSPM